ncbi:DUF2254 domain-containing protein [Thalassospira alkalitolerans]|uniref:DUF2254 domain-containing protein n=1 Tax=Thalassospira alkalitolerans TaxID=1293890 RepID=UPI003AA7D022
MFQRFIRIWEFLAYSLWLSPLLFAAGGAVLAVLLIQIPNEAANGILPVFWPRFDQLATVRDLLGTLLATLVTVTTFALSITMVVLTLAAGSLGPRMIRNFMGDSKTQNALGIFVGSILFLITSLMLMGDASEIAPALQVVTTAGIALFVVCVFVLILFVHHLGRSIVADEVIQRVGNNLEKTIASASNTLNDPIRAAEKAQITLPDTLDIPDQEALYANHSGYVQGIDYEKLRDVAQMQDICVSLMVRAGQHVIKGEIIGQISTTSTAETPQTAPATCQSKIGDHILIGNYRTAMLDIEFALRQLVELALRALSPGVNDPFTAIAVIYRLGRALPHAMAFRYPVGIWRDGDDTIRIQALLSDFTGMLGAAFDQIRQSASAKPDVLLPMAEIIESLLKLAKTDHQRIMLRDHARMILRAANRDIPEKSDRNTVETAINRILRCQGNTPPSQ